jgi:hypothetical protein
MPYRDPDKRREAARDRYARDLVTKAQALARSAAQRDRIKADPEYAARKLGWRRSYQKRKRAGLRAAGGAGPSPP